MGIEQQRKRLMTVCHQWGDPPSPPQRPQQSLQSKARDDFPEESLSVTDDLILNDMNKIVHPTPPISKSVVSSRGWTLENLLASGDKFRAVPRVSAVSNDLSSIIDEHEREGQPLIIEGWHEHPNWPADMFHIDWLREHGPQDISVRNIHDWDDKDLPLSEFIAKSRAASPFVVSEERERLYGKDAKCPREWDQWLHNSKVIPSTLLPEGSNNLLLNLPKSAQVETLMCYLGIGDTFTPSHKDLCASSGQNLMCYTENGGSSYWFMTESSAAPEATAYFHQLKQELDHETHVITVEELANAPFTVYVAEQRLGDMVLVPPRSCHQVVNHGGITVKTSWSRMTLTGLTTALYHELPIYRRVCRVEIYRVKSTVYYTLLQKTAELENLASSTSEDVDKDISSSSSTSRSLSPAMTRIPVSSSRNDPPSTSPADKSRKARLVADLSATIDLFDHILIEEYSEDHASMPCLLPSSSFPCHAASPSPSTSSSATLTCNEKENGDCHISCDFCGADIFQSFFECRECVALDFNGMEGVSGGKVPFGDGFAVCGGCYVEGRSCRCGSMTPAQCRPFMELLQDRRRAITALSAHWKVEGQPAIWRTELEGNLLSEEHLGIFRAACVLQQTRKNKKETRACTLKGPIPSHHVPFASALYCKKCHSTKCFSHILMDQRIHSADALLSHREDNTHEVFHRCHQMGRNTYEMRVAGLMESEKEGSRPDFRLQLVKTAMTFGTCKPVNPTFMKLGWYDISAQIVKIDIVGHEQAPEQAPIDWEISNPLDLYSPLSPLSWPSSPESLATVDLPSQSLHSPTVTVPSGVSGNLPSTPTSKMFLPSTQKRKRQILDCVFLPSLASVIRRQASSPLPSSLARNTGSKENRDGQDVDMSDPITSSRNDESPTKPAAPATERQTNNGPAIPKREKLKIIPRTMASVVGKTTRRIQLESSITTSNSQLLRAQNVVPPSGSAFGESNSVSLPPKGRSVKAKSRLPPAITEASSPSRSVDEESERPLKKSRTRVDQLAPVVSSPSRKPTGNSRSFKTGDAGPPLTKTTNSKSSHPAILEEPHELVKALNNSATNNSRKILELGPGTSRTAETVSARKRIMAGQSCRKQERVHQITPTRVGVLEEEVDSMKAKNSRLEQEVAELKQRMDNDAYRSHNNPSEHINPSFPMEQIAQSIVRNVGFLLTQSSIDQSLHTNHSMWMSQPHGWHPRRRGKGPFRGRGHTYALKQHPAISNDGQPQSGPSSAARRHSRSVPYPRIGPHYEEDHGSYPPIPHTRYSNTVSDRNSGWNTWSEEIGRGPGHTSVPSNGRVDKEHYWNDERWNACSKSQEYQPQFRPSDAYLRRHGMDYDTRRAGAATTDGSSDRWHGRSDRGWNNHRNSLPSRDSRAIPDTAEDVDRTGAISLSVTGSNVASDEGWTDRSYSGREVQSRDTQTHEGAVQKSRDGQGASSTDMAWHGTCEHADRASATPSEMTQPSLKPGFPPSEDGGQESYGTIPLLQNDRGVNRERYDHDHEPHSPLMDNSPEDITFRDSLIGDQTHERPGSPAYSEHWEDNYDQGGDEPPSRSDGPSFEFSLKPRESSSIQKVQSTPEEANPWA